MKKVSTLFLALVMVLSLTCTAAWADGEPVAQIGTATYTSLDEAVAAAKEAAEPTTITLLGNVAITGQVTLSAGTTLNGAGYTITANNSAWSTNADEKYMLVADGAGVTIKDVTLDGASQALFGMQFYNGVNGVMQNITVKNTQKCGLSINTAKVTATGTLTLENCGWGNAVNVSYGENIADGGDCVFDVSAATVTGVSTFYADKGDIGRAVAAGHTITIIPPTGWAETGSDTHAYIPVAAKIGSTPYVSLVDAVAAVKNDGVATTIKLLNSCAGGGIVVKAGQNIVFDLGGFTYTITAPVGSAGTVTNGMQLFKGSTVAIQNGTIAADADAGVKILIKNYSDLTLNNVILKGANVAQNMIANTGKLTVNGAATVIEKPTGVWAITTGNYGHGDVIVTTINAGLIDSVAIETPLWETDDATVDESVSVIINGGTIGKVGKYDWRSEYGGDYLKAPVLANPILSVKGGTFSVNPIDYVAKGYAVAKSGTSFTVNPVTTAAAVEVTTSGDTTTVNTVEPVPTAKTVTIDVSSTGADEVKLDSSVVPEVFKTTDTKPVEIKTEDVSVRFNATAVKKIAASATDADVVLAMDKEISDKTITLTITATAGENKLLTDKATSGSMVITIDVSGVFRDGNRVNIVHKDASGKVKGTYTATVSDGKVSFVNPNGLSSFTLTKTVVRPSTTKTTTTTTTTTVPSPQTGDAGVVLYALSAVLSLTGMGYLGKKKSNV